MESSTLEPISGSLSRRYSTRMVANRADVDRLARKEFATIWKKHRETRHGVQDQGDRDPARASVGETAPTCSA